MDQTPVGCANAERDKTAMQKSVRHIVAALALAGPLFAGVALVGAQQSLAQTAAPQAENPAAVPSLDLSQSQRHTIYQSVKSQTSKSTAAPSTFLPRVGATVPAGVDLAPMPKVIADLIPKTATFLCALVADQAIIVEPKSRQVVEVIVDGG